LDWSIEERVIYRQRFQGETLDFRQLAFLRYDECEFVKCTLLMDGETGNLAFTRCSFEDCNLTELTSDETRAILAEDNVFNLPIDDRMADLSKRLAEAVAKRSPA
jgi:hypothetical protein